MASSSRAATRCQRQSGALRRRRRDCTQGSNYFVVDKGTIAKPLCTVTPPPLSHRLQRASQALHSRRLDASLPCGLPDKRRRRDGASQGAPAVRVAGRGRGGGAGGSSACVPACLRLCLPWDVQAWLGPNGWAVLGRTSHVLPETAGCGWAGLVGREPGLPEIKGSAWSVAQLQLAATACSAA